MPTKGEGAIGALDFPPEERKKLAALSVDFACEKCGAKMCTALPPIPKQEEAATTTTTTTTTTEATSDTVPAPAEEPSTPTLTPAPAPTPSNNNNNNHSISNNNNIPTVYTPPPLPPQHHDDVHAEPAFFPHAQPVPAANLPNPNNVAAPMLMQAQAPVPAAAAMHVQGVSADTTQGIDYLILAVVVAIIALIIRKMYFSAEAV